MLARGEFALGTVAHMRDPAIVELIALAGFDWVSFTLEHATHSVADLEALQRAADLHGLTTLLHVRSAADPRLLSLLHTGIRGFVLQQAASREDVEALVRLTRFPPLGERGAHAGVRADRYGVDDYGEFMKAANRSFVVGVAIEDVEGVEHAEEILSVEGITLAFVGLHDLSHSVGAPNELNHPRVLEALERVAALARRYGIPLGLPGYAHTVAELRALGAQLAVSPGNEYAFIRSAFAEHVRRSREEAQLVAG
ncbi:MAG: 2-dehydro-3-deoxyglucarate aldolase [Solirubrobacterales bacterium]|nr:2-dehydro-3-deoxyglucarate aldolase [Solirubrobacterales bacterium]